MKAVIMGGGEGKRLMPVTERMPKPMAPVLCKPAIVHIVEKLKAAGITDIAVTLMYLPEKITECLGDGSDFGVNISYFTEETPLGTAGSVKNAEAFLDEDFIVISGDCICGFDITAAAAFHGSVGADVTILASRQKDPREYGVIVGDSGGRILCFAEKPGWNDAVSDMVNAGIYIIKREILEMIPPMFPFDFSKDLFPLMMRQKKHLFVYEDTRYWNDIGDLKTYLNAQFDALDGICGEDMNAAAGELIIKNRMLPHKYTANLNVHVIPPCFIAAGAAIADGAVIGPYAVVGGGSTVESGGEVRKSVLMDGVRVGAEAVIQQSVLCGKAFAGAGSQLNSCVLGEGSVVEPNAVLFNTRLMSEGYGRERECGVFEGFDGHRFVLDISELQGNAEPFAHALSATLSEHKRIGIMSDPSPTAAAAKSAFGAALLLRGIKVCDFSTGFLSLASYAPLKTGLDYSLFFSIEGEGNKCRIYIFDGDGMSLTRAEERRLSAAYAEFDTCARAAGNSAEIELAEDMQGLRLVYQKDVIKETCLLTSFPTAVSVRSDNAIVSDILQKALILSGVSLTPSKSTVPLRSNDNNDNDDCNVLRISINTAENELTVSSDGVAAGDERIMSIIAVYEAGEAVKDGISGQSGEIVLPFSAPSILDDRCGELGIRPLHYYDVFSDGSDRRARLIASNRRWLADPCVRAVKLLCIMNETRLSLPKLLEAAPGFYTSEAEVKCDCHDRAIAIRNIISENPGAFALNSGMVVRTKTGTVRLLPKGAGGMTVRAESGSMEAAEELCKNVVGTDMQFFRQGDEKFFSF